MQSPESSFEAAREALQRKDLEDYFDALTDAAVRKTLSNSIAICLGSFRPEHQRFGYEPSVGCPEVLEEYGWLGPSSHRETVNAESWDEALENISEPRAMAVKLESLHRQNNAGSSFVWEYLEAVTLEDVQSSESNATATARWAQGTTEVRFEKDETGWRFDPNPE